MPDNNLNGHPTLKDNNDAIDGINDKTHNTGISEIIDSFAQWIEELFTNIFSTHIEDYAYTKDDLNQEIMDEMKNLTQSEFTRITPNTSSIEQTNQILRDYINSLDSIMKENNIDPKNTSLDSEQQKVVNLYNNLKQEAERVVNKQIERINGIEEYNKSPNGIKNQVKQEIDHMKYNVSLASFDWKEGPGGESHQSNQKNTISKSEKRVMEILESSENKHVKEAIMKDFVKAVNQELKNNGITNFEFKDQKLNEILKQEQNQIQQR